METVWRWLKKTGEVRTSGEGLSLGMAQGRIPPPPNQRIYSLDEGVFERDLTCRTAWLLGLAFADGCVRECRGLMLACGPDEDMAYKASVILGYGGDPFFKDGSWMLEVGSYRLGRSLARRGVWPRKTYTMEFPALEDGLLHHFVRGLWEGDGTMSLLRTGKLFVKYGSSSREFVVSLRQQLRRRLGVKSKLAGDTFFEVKYGSRTAEKIADFMYQDSEEEMRCDRKWGVYSRFKSMRKV